MPTVFDRQPLRLSLLCMAAVLGAASSAAAQVLPPEASAGQRANYAALGARLLCGGALTASRPPEAVVRNDLAPQNPGFWRTARWRVDPQARRVSVAWPADATEAHAVHTPGHGCAVVGGATEAPPLAPRPSPPRAADLPRGAFVGDEAKLQAVGDAAFGAPATGQGRSARALLVLQHGRVVYERYAPGYGPETKFLSWSSAKGVTATLVGAFAHAYGLELDAHGAVQAWSGAQDPRRAITVRNLLQMASGLDFPNPNSDAPDRVFTTEDAHLGVYFGTGDLRDTLASARLAHRPGSRFQYKNIDAAALALMMRERLSRFGEDPAVWPHEAVFGPIGAQSFELDTDAAGNVLGSGMMYASAPDYARLGQLLAQDGVWAGRRILPAGWARLMAEPSAAEPGYGALVMLRSDWFPHLPPDGFVAFGNLAQAIVVAPSQGLVIVRLGHTDPAEAVDVVSRLIEGVLEAARPASTGPQ